MNGRLGMVGSSVARGDKEIYKAMSTRKQVAAGVGIAGVSGLTGMAAGTRRGIRYGERAGIEYSADPDKHMQEYVRSVLDRKKKVAKADTTMSDREAKKLSAKYDTRGPLPKGLDRESKMKAYEARYIASGGKQGEKWKRRADRAEVGRNVGLATATASGAALLTSRGRIGGKLIAKVPKVTPHRIEGAALASAVGGGSAELYGEHARHRRASYANSPAGIAGSALTRMRAYTPGAKP